ncbi:uncharacterized protein LOC101743274 [Bombyx mori]|uniref:Uncharacterized protein n=1 Tax=Bombyx mori TaxID=7091 RepID=A0A8R2QYB6_BOMMO|nr:uncharacterized protein LOC101743274 [Bombyx mori]
MKRVKESGASFRKKRKKREEIQIKNTGALLKYISHKPTSSSFSIVASNTGEEAALEGEKTLSNVVQEERPVSHTGEEVESLSSPNEESAAQIILSVSMKDIGLWPNKIDDNTRVFLVHQGPFLIQNLDADFGEGIKRSNNTSKAKGETRKLSRDWFFQILPNGEKLLRSYITIEEKYLLFLLQTV